MVDDVLGSYLYELGRRSSRPAFHGEFLVHGHNLDWRRFVTPQTADFCRHEMASVRPANPDLPITTNMHMIEGLDYRKLAKEIDVISWDAYPTWHSAADDSGRQLSLPFITTCTVL